MLEWLANFLQGFLDLFKFWTVVDHYERGVVLTLGKLRPKRGRWYFFWLHKDVELAPGLHLLIPFGVDNVFTANIVQETSNLGSQSLSTLDGKFVIVSVVLTYRIKDVRKLLLEVEDAENVLEDSTYGLVAESIESSTWEQICDPGFTEYVYKKVRQKAFNWGIEVTALQFTDKTVSKTLRIINEAWAGEE